MLKKKKGASQMRSEFTAPAGASNLMFLYDLKENYCHKDARLEVNKIIMCAAHDE
jgi:hypothetical protein